MTCVVATSVSTHAADSTEASAESALESAVEKEVGELLIASPPAGWTLDFATNAPDLRIAEYSRDDEDSELWTQKIKFESLAGHLLPEPVEFFRSFAENQKKPAPNWKTTVRFPALRTVIRRPFTYLFVDATPFQTFPW